MKDYVNEFSSVNTSQLSPAEYFALKEKAEKHEHTELFTSASLLAILLLLYELFNYVFGRVMWYGAYRIYSGKTSFDLSVISDYFYNENKDVLGSTAFNMSANLFIIGSSAIMIFIIGQFIFRIKLTDVMRPYRRAVPDGIRFFPSTLTLNIMSSLLITTIVSSLKDQGITVPGTDFSVKSPSAYALIIQFVYVCLLGPVCEEFIYRGLFIKLLSPYGKWLAVGFSAFCFGIMHGNLEQAVPAMVTGLLYALVAVRYDSIAPTIIIHILNNICASINDFGAPLGWTNTDMINRLIDIIGLFLGFYGLIVLLAEIIADVHEQEPDCVLPAKKRLFSSITNIFMLIYLAVILWDLVEKIIRAN